MEYILIALLTRYTYDDDDGIGAILQEFGSKQMCVAAGDMLMRKYNSLWVSSAQRLLYLRS